MARHTALWRYAAYIAKRKLVPQPPATWRLPSRVRHGWRVWLFLPNIRAASAAVEEATDHLRTRTNADDPLAFAGLALKPGERRRMVIAPMAGTMT